MRLRNRVAITVAGLALCCVLIASSQEPPHFYNVDREVDINGTVREVIMEPRYQDKAAFLTVVLEDKKTGKRYDVGKSCVRFRKLDDLPLLLIGNSIKAMEMDEFVEQVKTVSARKAKKN